MFSRILTLLCITSVVAQADIPTRVNYNRYYTLVKNSPFTSEPVKVVPEESPRNEALADYALGGVAKFSDGYYVVLINKKDQNKQEVVGQEPLEHVSVVSVSHGSDSVLSEDYSDGTEVTLMADGQRVLMRFEDQYLAVNKPKPAPNPQQKVNANPLGLPNNNANNNTNRRTPRPRVVVPPNNNNNNSGQNNNQRPPGLPRSGGGR